MEVAKRQTTDTFPMPFHFILDLTIRLQAVPGPGSQTVKEPCSAVCSQTDSKEGDGDSSAVRAPDSWLKGRGFESLLERRENFLLQGRLSVLTLIFRYPFHPRVTEVARKRSRSFCQKSRWQVTAKHAYILRMWLCMKWHGAWLYGVHRTCSETAAVSCGTSHASAVSTPLRWILKKRAIKLVTHVELYASAVSLLKRTENSAI